MIVLESRPQYLQMQICESIIVRWLISSLERKLVDFPLIFWLEEHFDRFFFALLMLLPKSVWLEVVDFNDVWLIWMSSTSSGFGVHSEMSSSNELSKCPESCSWVTLPSWLLRFCLAAVSSFRPSWIWNPRCDFILGFGEIILAVLALSSKSVAAVASSMLVIGQDDLRLRSIGSSTSLPYSLSCFLLFVADDIIKSKRVSTAGPMTWYFRSGSPISARVFCIRPSCFENNVRSSRRRFCWARRNSSSSWEIHIRDGVTKLVEFRKQNNKNKEKKEKCYQKCTKKYGYSVKLFGHAKHGHTTPFIKIKWNHVTNYISNKTNYIFLPMIIKVRVSIMFLLSD